MTKYPGLSRAIGVLATSGIVGAGLAAVAAGPASAATLSCGMTITSSIKLHRNLNCRGYTAGSALTIGAVGLTVNLNGHTITGPGISAKTYGIYDGGFKGLTVTGGKIKGFSTDVRVEGAIDTPLTGVVIEHLTISTGAPSYGNDYSAAVYGAYLSGARIHNLAVSDVSVGVQIEVGKGSVVSWNRLSGVLYGFYDDYGTTDTWSHNTVTDVLYEGLYAQDTTGTVVSHNSMSGTAGYGVASYHSTGLAVTRNTFTSMYDAYYGNENHANSVTGNKSSHCTWGIYSQDAARVTFSHNTFSNGVFGIEADYPTSVRLIRNVTNRNADTGVYIYDDVAAPPTSYAARLVRNTAKYNRFGLYSQITTTGTGNRAVHNKVLNCHNVACVRAALALAGHHAPAHLVPRAPHAPAPGLAARR